VVSENKLLIGSNQKRWRKKKTVTKAAKLQQISRWRNTCLGTVNRHQEKAALCKTFSRTLLLSLLVAQISHLLQQCYTCSIPKFNEALHTVFATPISIYNMTVSKRSQV